MEALIANHQRRFWKTSSAYRSVLHERAAGAALWKQASERRVHLVGCIRIPLRISLCVSLCLSLCPGTCAHADGYAGHPCAQCVSSVRRHGGRGSPGRRVGRYRRRSRGHADHGQRCPLCGQWWRRTLGRTLRGRPVRRGAWAASPGGPLWLRKLLGRLWFVPVVGGSRRCRSLALRHRAPPLWPRVRGRLARLKSDSACSCDAAAQDDVKNRACSLAWRYSSRQ